MDLPAAFHGPVPLALAKAADRFPPDATMPGGRRWELKFDGYRAAATCSHRGVRLLSRQGRDLTDQFPDVQTALRRQLTRPAVLDGELVIWDGHRLDFDALQRRMLATPRRASQLTADRPASYVAFDLLALGDRDLRAEPWTERRRQLAALAETWRPPPQLCPATDDETEAREWLSLYRDAGIEGLVVKGAASPYRGGHRDWVKVKHRKTIDAVIGAVTGSLAFPETIVAGQFTPEGVLVIVGRTAPLTPQQAADVVTLLTPARPGHPWPDTIGSGGWTPSSGPQPLTKVQPEVVIEVAADPARHAGRYRHPLRYLRARPDLSAADIHRYSND